MTLYSAKQYKESAKLIRANGMTAVEKKIVTKFLINLFTIDNPNGFDAERFEQNALGREPAYNSKSNARSAS